jgi:deoxycytidylate deaminase
MTNTLVLTQRHTHCINIAMEQALRSPCTHKHGCAILAGGKIIGKGFNNYRTFSHDKLIHDCLTCHAEIAAIRDCLRTHHKVVQG